MPVTLNAGVNVTLNSSGAGTVTAGPNMPGVIWTVNMVACYTTTNLSGGTTFYLYTNSVSPVNLVGGSYSGNLDQNSDLSISLFPGQTIIGVWADGDSGAVATMSYYGSMTVNGK
jgi:hypothetical protein